MAATRHDDAAAETRGDAGTTGELASWLEAHYTTSFRTACLILGNRADAEEAVQEAFLRAWRFRDSLSAETDLKRWLYRVVVNTCNSKLRVEIPHRDNRSSDDELDTVANPEDALGRTEQAHDLAGALLDLPVALRVVVVLRYYVDLSEREIATAIGRPVGTVKSRLHEARRLLAGHRLLRSTTDAPTDSEAQR